MVTCWTQFCNLIKKNNDAMEIDVFLLGKWRWSESKTFINLIKVLRTFPRKYSIWSMSPFHLCNDDLLVRLSACAGRQAPPPDVWGWQGHSSHLHHGNNNNNNTTQRNYYNNINNTTTSSDLRPAVIEAVPSLNSHNNKHEEFCKSAERTR